MMGVDRLGRLEPLRWPCTRPLRMRVREETTMKLPVTLMLLVMTLAFGGYASGQG